MSCDAIECALKALQEGKMVLLYDADDREGETDIVIPARSITPRDVALLRNDAGGLICVAIHPQASEKLGLPFMSDLIINAYSRESDKYGKIINVVEKEGDLKYDNKSAFSIWVNHRDTFTGIPDNDRALTINKLDSIVKRAMNGGAVDFGSEFRAPGHVALLRAADRLVDERCGQTELSIVAAEMAGITPAMVMCEMLDDETGGALSKENARKYASRHGIPFIEGVDVIDAYKNGWETGEKKS